VSTDPPLPRVMGVINVTPDSFSGDGVLLGPDYIAKALLKAQEMIANGAAILDVGGESSRPGAVSVSLEEELNRVIPVISAIRKKFSAIEIAIDTVKAKVAKEALRAGATIINDISALVGDPLMGEAAKNSAAKIVLMHNRTKSGASQHDAKIGGQYEAPNYEEVVSDVIKDLCQSVQEAQNAGIERDHIILDPGIGFGKTPKQNMALIMHLDQIKTLGFPVLMGVSRKSFIGHILDLPIEERLEGTAACVTTAVLKGADIVRVHDVKFMARVVKMAAALRDA